MTTTTVPSNRRAVVVRLLPSLFLALLAVHMMGSLRSVTIIRSYFLEPSQSETQQLHTKKTLTIISSNTTFLRTPSEPGLTPIIVEKNISNEVKTNTKEEQQHQHHRALLASYVFGEDAVSQHYLRMFLRSATTCGMDVVLIGLPCPSYPLPGSGRVLSIVSWKHSWREIKRW